MKQLLIEYYQLQVSPEQLNEGLAKDGKVYVETILQRANSKNQNGRIYPREVLEREIDNYIKGPIAENRALGELDHSETGVINLKNACLIVKKVWWDGDTVKGLIEILNTPSGKILQELLKAGVTVGISSRGMGTVDQVDENTLKVGEDFSLLCWDAVSTPSTHQAFMKPISLNEGHVPSETDKFHKVNDIIRDMICLKSGVCSCQFKK